MSEDRLSGVYAVVGPPGTGKTTFVGAQVRAICERVPWYTGNENNVPAVVCSLTRTAAAEAAGRKMQIPRTAVGTLHSFAFRALNRPKMAAGKALKQWNAQQAQLAVADDDDDDTDYAVDEGMVERPEDAGPGQRLAERYHLLRHRMVDRRSWPTSVLEFAALWEHWKRDAGVMDFTDLIEEAAACADHCPGRPGVLLCDEAQDMSALEFALVQKWGRAAGALIVVGDPDQALYSWRGAHPGLFDDVPPDRRRTLSRSYRVPLRVLAVARHWATQLSRGHTAEYQPRVSAETDEVADGQVVLSGSNWRAPSQLVAEALDDLETGRTVMVTAACGYMLNPLIAELRKRGVPYANPWRRNHGGWNPMGARRGVPTSQRLLAFLWPLRFVSGSASEWWTLSQAALWSDLCKTRDLFQPGGREALDRDAAEQPDADLPAVNPYFRLDAFGALSAIVHRHVGARDSSGVEAMMGWLAGVAPAKARAAVEYPMAVVAARGPAALRDEPRLFVGSIHSFKGGEADAVYCVPDVSPSGYREWSDGGEARDSVVRLFYVAATRAREKLVLTGAASSVCMGLQQAALDAGAVSEAARGDIPI